jgi:hypothetical protein
LIATRFARAFAAEGVFMRSVIAATAIAVAMCGTAAHAEKRLFILASQPDGYGVDNCLASGGACGRSVANSYCRSHSFAQADSFRKVSRDDITGAIPTDVSASCKGGACDHYVAIQCSR